MERLTEDILKKHKFIKYLNAENNKKIKDISWMKNLKELYAGVDSEIDQMGIEELNLIKLKVNNNSKIKNVSWMKNLKELYADGTCGIDQSLIKLSFGIIQ